MAIGPTTYRVVQIPGEVIWPWDDRGHSALVVHRLTQVRVVEDPWAGVCCVDGHFVPLTASGGAPRHCECGRRVHRGQWAVRERWEPFVASPAAVPAATWWHVSQASDLFENDRNAPMHWGSECAARARFADLEHSDGSWYLYEVSVRSTTAVSDTMYAESQVDLFHEQAVETARSTGALVRYINLKEEPGSISLVGFKDQFELRSRSLLA